MDKDVLSDLLLVVESINEFHDWLKAQVWYLDGKGDSELKRAHDTILSKFESTVIFIDMEVYNER